MSNSSNSGIGCLGFFLSLLAVLFIGLKLTDNIDWPWLIVLMPLWGIPAMIIGVIAVFMVAILLYTLVVYVATKIRMAYDDTPEEEE